MTQAPEILTNQRHLFDLPDEVAYLNCAYMSPLMNSVVAAGEAAVRAKRHPWDVTPETFFTLPDEGRALFGRIVGASAEEIAIVPAVSYAMAIAAKNIAMEKGQEIVVLEDQFPSNVYPWREKAKETGGKVVTVPLPRLAGGENAYEGWTPRVLEAIGPDTAIVALPHCHWTDGGLIDLIEVGRKAREVGAALVLDVTQSAGAWPIDVQAVQPDYLVSAGYKWLMGPYTLGFLYIAPHRQGGEPLEHNWIGRKGSEDFSRLVFYQDDPAPGVRRFDMGERSNFHLMPMAVAAMEQLLDWGIDNIAATLTEKTRAIAERGREIGLTPVPDRHRAGHYLGLRFPGGVPDGLREQLAERQVYVSFRGNSMRVTPHLYNTDADVDRLFGVLAELL